MRRLSLFLVFCASLLVAGCSASAQQRVALDPFSSAALPLTADGELGGDFAASAPASRFVVRMAREHGFAPEVIAGVLSEAQREQWIIELMDRQAPRASRSPSGAWTRYRGKFVTADNIAGGVRFWRAHTAPLARASARYGVAPEYIVAILGVETRYGGYVGTTRVLDALATLAFAYPRRADYFSGELEAFLLMARESGIDPREPRGSYAGAMGLGQFMPTSFQRYAVDFDDDGVRDLWNPNDAIGSVAHYFKAHGWRSGEPVAVRVSVRSGQGVGALKTGFSSRHGRSTLSAHGVDLDGVPGRGGLSLLSLDARGGPEYWVGFDNFRVITRYNRSTYYAMAVHQLATAIRARHGAALAGR
ncbi:lytic murein transglycosylase B [Marichromatium bheemlicum]|uniref:Lytic murein transglycosylase B n=1 Tax=Marichromatium bheemlicum TaxID=365339 RepID=A0ABX1I7J1_9GAMM|nr:lytic murein transglycosylase B [Marichromatium bheemlicum]NKN32190.1 lytic murein transglycosylase B [Marichromatium bheemlicum]